MIRIFCEILNSKHVSTDYNQRFAYLCLFSANQKLILEALNEITGQKVAVKILEKKKLK